MTSSHDPFTRENCSLITDRFQNVRLLWTLPPPDATHLKEKDKEQNGPPVREQSMQPEKASAPLQTLYGAKWRRNGTGTPEDHRIIGLYLRWLSYRQECICSILVLRQPKMKSRCAPISSGSRKANR